MVKRFRKKPVEIEAVLWNGKNHEEVLAWVTGSTHFAERRIGGRNKIMIPYLMGAITASQGDYIMRIGINQFYPCNPKEFESTYEEIV